MEPKDNREKLSELLERELISIVNSRPVKIYEIMSYHMGWNQNTQDSLASYLNRSRGILCLLSCIAAGGSSAQALPAATAVELVHSFTQIHDDVQDGKPKRGERDSIWWKWGPAQAINTGDGMHALARLSLLQLLDRDVESSVVFNAVQSLDEASLKACEGRFMDLEAQERIDLSSELYYKMASAKTGALLECAMKLGGILGGANQTTVKMLGDCGNLIGIAWQMRSDMKEFWSPETNEPSAEIMNKKKLLPVVLALERATISEKRQIGEIYFKRILTPEDVNKLKETLETLEINKYCEQSTREYYEQGLKFLDIATLSEVGKHQIKEMVAALLK